ncbi:MAG TPA: hypothetical protein DHM37_00335, partial [Candidatus Cloacimonas sp.]|nr:hypothetical protein [Candidatus Cloacimonas sp.]
MISDETSSIEKEQSAQKKSTNTAELTNSDDKFRFFTENVPGVVSIYKWYPNAKREVIFQGPGLEEIIGTKLAQKVKDDIEEYFKLIPTEDFQKLDKEALKALKSNNKLKSQYRLQVSKNKYKWVESHFSIFPQEDGSILWQGIIFQITQQKTPGH